MTEKDLAKQVLDALPNEATFDDILRALFLRAKFARGETEIRDGKGVSHDEAKRRLAGGDDINQTL